MKDNLFEMLLNLFEKSLTQLRNSHQTTTPQSNEDLLEETAHDNQHMLSFTSPHETSARVFTHAEQLKLTKASQQFLMRMKLWHVVDHELFENILNQLLRSDSRIVTLQETKWTMRNIIAPSLSEHQLAFLDLVIYQAEDKHTLQ